MSRKLFDAAALTNENRKLELLNQLRVNPTKEIRDELILGHLALGMSIVGRYIKRSKLLTEELISAMFEAVVHAVNKPPEHNNITGYVIDTIHSYLSKTLENMPVVRVPGSTRRARKARNLDTPRPEIVELSPAITRECVNKDLVYVDIHDIIRKVCQTQMEKDVISLRWENYSDSEIGEKLGLNRVTVWHVRQAIQQHYRDLNY